VSRKLEHLASTVLLVVAVAALLTCFNIVAHNRALTASVWRMLACSG